MSRADLLKKINKALSPNKVDFSAIDSEINTLKKKLEETVNIQTVDDVKFELDKFKKKIDFTPLLQEITKIKELFEQRTKEIQAQIKDKSLELDSAKIEAEKNGTEVSSKILNLTSEIASLKHNLAEIEVFHEADMVTINQNIASVRSIEGRVQESIQKLAVEVETKANKETTKKSLKEVTDSIEKLRQELLTRISNIHGGGNANRQMFIGGVDPLKSYTDMNLKAGSNVTITYANNNATKKVDVTFAATGGPGGNTRSIQSISASQSADGTAGSDFVYLCSGTMTLTMPTAVGNTNLYTVKNVGTGIVTINCTGAETIDNDATVVMPVRYTSVDLISDTVNWNVT